MKIKEQLPPIVTDKYLEFSRLRDEAFFQGLSARIESHQLAGSTAFLGPRAVSRMVLDALSTRAPFSLIRLSDGEGNVLANIDSLGAHPELINWATRRISNVHFGDDGVVPNALPFFVNFLRSAADGAAVIGFPSKETVLANVSAGIDDVNVRAVVGNRFSYAFLAAQLDEGRKVQTTSAWISRGLLPYYKQIIAAAPSVCIITSYPEVAGLLSSAYGYPLDRIRTLRVPVQAVYTASWERQDTRHYPDAMSQILDAIKGWSEPCLYLVAAGLLGKHYCELARATGNVAIDIGSIVEIWLGIQTRGIPEELYAKWQLAPSSTA